MPTVETIITIRLDPDSKPGDHGIATGAETLVDECFYSNGSTVDDALVSASEALRSAADSCDRRAEGV